MIGRKVNNVRVFPVTVKIVITFAIFILFSNFTTNYINLMFNRNELFKLMNELLTKDLKNIYSYCGNQHEIYQYDQNLQGSIDSIEKMGRHSMKSEKGIIIGLQPDGVLLFQASKIPRVERFADSDSLALMKSKMQENKDEGSLYFRFNDENYFGMYKYNQKWNAFVIRAEELNEFYSNSRRIFIIVGVIIALVTVVVALIGIIILRYLLRYIDIMT